jgi:hypothetical protein
MWMKLIPDNQFVAHGPAGQPPTSHQHRYPSVTTNHRQSAREMTIRTHYSKGVVDIDLMFPIPTHTPTKGEILTEGRVGPLCEIVATSSSLLYSWYKRPHPGHCRRTLGRQLEPNRYIDSMPLDVTPSSWMACAVAADSVSHLKFIC